MLYIGVQVSVRSSLILPKIHCDSLTWCLLVSLLFLAPEIRKKETTQNCMHVSQLKMYIATT